MHFRESFMKSFYINMNLYESYEKSADYKIKYCSSMLFK